MMFLDVRWPQSGHIIAAYAHEIVIFVFEGDIVGLYPCFSAIIAFVYRDFVAGGDIAVFTKEKRFFIKKSYGLVQHITAIFQS